LFQNVGDFVTRPLQALGLMSFASMMRERSKAMTQRRLIAEGGVGNLSTGPAKAKIASIPPRLNSQEARLAGLPPLSWIRM